MKHCLLLVCLVLSAYKLSGQVEKDIVIDSRPGGAVLNMASGKADFVGNTPLKKSFSFHSEISILKLKLSACGYYDTIFRISPGDDTIRINLEKKEFHILPESDKDTLSKKELKILSSVMNDFLNDFAARNIGKPVNFTDFAVLRTNDGRKSITVMFEADPSGLSLPRTLASDSLMIRVWNDLFAASLGVLNRKGNIYPGNTEIYFSVISGKKNMSVRHLPGVEVSDELRSQTTVYEDDYKRVTTTTFYYETVTNPTFNSSVSQTQKYNEILFRLASVKEGKNFSLAGTAAMNMTNGRMNVLYESQPGLSSSSMLTRFMNSVPQ